MKIAFMGASGTGKSTLARYVSQRYQIPINPIGSRSVAASMGFENPYDVDRAGRREEFQLRLMREKLEWESHNRSFVTDRTALDQYIYAELENARTPERELEWMLHDIQANLIDAAYDLVFWTPVEYHQSLDGDPSRKVDADYHQHFEKLIKQSLHYGRFSLVTALTCSELTDRQEEVDYQIGRLQEHLANSRH